MQGPPGQESAGYHGYWITDFTHVDPHFGTNADFKALVDAAHARGMKVYMDIVVNHTADVIYFAECGGQANARTGASPIIRTSAAAVRTALPINPGFIGERDGTAANFARLTDPNYAYTVEVPPEERNIKVPAWLNDPIYYHNRGDSTFRGEVQHDGGLRRPRRRVHRESARHRRAWSTSTPRWIDGYRRRRLPHRHGAARQSRVLAEVRAGDAGARRRDGIPNFHIFGEVSTSEMDPAHTAVNTRVDKLPAVLDFALTRARCGRRLRNVRHG